MMNTYDIDYILENFDEEDAIILLPIIAGGKGGGGGSVPANTTQVTTQKTEPWAEQKPYLTNIFSRAQDFSYKRPLVYGRQGEPTIASFTPEQQMAMDLTKSRALLGNPIQKLSNVEMLKTVSGEYINPKTNPYLKDYANLMLEESGVPDMDAAAIKAGRYGGDAWGLMRGKALSDLGARLYGSERENQMRAMFASPQYVANDYADIGKLASVGEQKQAMNQAMIDEARRIALESDPVRQELAALQQYSNFVQGHYGSTSDMSASGSSLTPRYSAPLSTTLIGGGLLGLGMLPYLTGGK